MWLAQKNNCFVRKNGPWHCGLLCVHTFLRNTYVPVFGFLQSWYLNCQCPSICYWLVVDLPLWKMMGWKSVGMIIPFPIWWESHNPAMFQSPSSENLSRLTKQWRQQLWDWWNQQSEIRAIVGTVSFRPGLDPCNEDGWQDGWTMDGHISFRFMVRTRS